MDILFLIKAEHSRLQELVGSLAKGPHNARELRADLGALDVALETFIALDRELLYPELSELFSLSGRVIAEGHSHHRQLLELLADSREALRAGPARLDSVAAALREAVQSHLLHQQEQVLPRLRELIPTQEREDLGQVYLEMREERTKLGPSLCWQEQVS